MKTFLKFIGEHLKQTDKILPVICLLITAFDIFLVNTMYQTGIIDIGTLRTQIVSAVIGIVLAVVISFIDYRFMSKMWFVIAPAAMILQLLLFTPLGQKREGADDVAWLNIFGFSLQPSEILKFAFIITLATHISKLGDKINHIPQFLLVCLHGLVPVLIILKQGDAGSALVFLFIFICMLFMGGLSWKFFAVGIAAIPPIFYVVWNFIMQDVHRNRILILFDKELQEQERLGDYYQQYNGTIALGSGQLTGVGFDPDKFTETPEIYNDYVFAYIGMTMGFIGCMAVVIALALLCLKLLSNVSSASDMLGKLMCTGVFAIIFFHSVINIGMVLSVVPVIGIPLPFISTGGTAMMMMHVEMGLVLSVSSHKTKEKHMFY